MELHDNKAVSMGEVTTIIYHTVALLWFLLFPDGALIPQLKCRVKVKNEIPFVRFVQSLVQSASRGYEKFAMLLRCLLNNRDINTSESSM